MPSQSDFTRIEGLASQAFPGSPASAYAPWLAARGAGLKAVAKVALEAFLKESEAWPEAERREFVLWLDGVRDSLDDPGAIAPQPVMMRMVLPTLRTWAAAEPQAAQPHLLLGRFHVWRLDGENRLVHFRRALERDPSLVAARRGLILALFDLVERNQHHLPEDYLGDRNTDAAHMDEAFHLSQAMPNAAEAEDLSRYAAVLRDRAVGGGAGGGLAIYGFQNSASRPR